MHPFRRRPAPSPWPLTLAVARLIMLAAAVTLLGIVRHQDYVREQQRVLPGDEQVPNRISVKESRDCVLYLTPEEWDYATNGQFRINLQPMKTDADSRPRKMKGTK